MCRYFSGETKNIMHPSRRISGIGRLILIYIYFIYIFFFGFFVNTLINI